MPTPTRIASPSWARVDAGAAAPWSFAGDAAVIHRGRSCVLLESDLPGVLVVAGPGFGLAPGGIQLTDADFARFAAAVPEGGRVDLSTWDPGAVIAADLSIRRSPIAPSALAVHREALRRTPGAPGPMDPAPIRELGDELAATALEHGDLALPLAGLIGAGPGSTPTGDDVVVGVLAGLRAGGAPDAAFAIGDAVLPMVGRTTTASAHYLRAAAAGRFADRVRDLVAGLATAERAARESARAARWGATSGFDLLAGVVAAAGATTAHSTQERLTA